MHQQHVIQQQFIQIEELLMKCKELKSQHQEEVSQFGAQNMNMKDKQMKKKDPEEQKLTMEGHIDDHKCQIFGKVLRRNGPDGPCYNCANMLKAKASRRILRSGKYCQYAGRRMPGHILELPEELVITFEVLPVYKGKLSQQP